MARWNGTSGIGIWVLYLFGGKERMTGGRGNVSRLLGTTDRLMEWGGLYRISNIMGSFVLKTVS